MALQFLLFLFPRLRALVYLHLRWLVFWFSSWEAAKEHLLLLWLAWLIPQLVAMA